MTAPEGNGLTSKELMGEIRTDVKTLLRFMERLESQKLDDRLCELEDKRIPRIEQWQWRTAGALGVVATIGALLAGLALKYL